MQGSGNDQSYVPELPPVVNAYPVHRNHAGSANPFDPPENKGSGRIVRDERYHENGFLRFASRLCSLSSTLWTDFSVHASRNIKWSVVWIDRNLPGSWNPKNRESGGDTRFRRAVDQAYYDRYWYGKRAILFVAMVFLFLFLGSYAHSMVPWHRLGRAPIVTVADRNGVVTDFYRPDRMMPDIQRVELFTQRHYHMKTSLSKEDVMSGSVTLEGLDPKLYYGRDRVTVSFEVLRSKMVADIEAAMSYRDLDGDHATDNADGVACAIEYGIPINMIVIRNEDKQFSTMFRPELNNFFVRELFAPRPTAEVRHTFPNCTDGKCEPHFISTFAKASISYLTIHGTRAKQVLEGGTLSHVAFCITWL